ncbi:hypothetical protein ACFLZM_08095 [Thermodesulfobacteriota bacterium]
MSIHFIKCPFCTEGYIAITPGRSICAGCSAKYRIDDQEEYIFVDLKSPSIPINDTYCMACGLVQSPFRKRCRYCGAKISSERQ